MRQKLAELINIIFGFRKFILMMLLFAIGIVFRLNDKVNGQEFVDLMKNTAIAFFAANGIEHLTETVKTYVSSKAGAAAVTEEVVEGPASEDAK